MWSEQQHHPSSWAQPASDARRVQHMQSSAMTGPSLPQLGFSDHMPEQGALPPIFHPNMFAFNNTPQAAHHKATVTSGLSFTPDAAQNAPRQLVPTGPLADNLPLGEGGATARTRKLLGSLHSANAMSASPSSTVNPPSPLPVCDVDVTVRVAPNTGLEAERARQQPVQSSELRHVSSAESRELHEVGFDLAQAGPDATSGLVTRTRRRATAGRPKYSDYFTDDGSPSESEDDDGEEDDDFLSETSMRDGAYALQSRNSSLQSADASHYRSSGLDEEGRSKRSAAAKKPRSKQLLCEQDPEAPGLTLEQRRKIRRRINNRASARRVRQKREEDLQKITTLVSRLDEEKNALVARASQFQSSCMALGTQLKEARDRWQATCLTNAALQRELMALRAQAHEWQKTGIPNSPPAQQQPPLDRQASGGAPAGPATPRPSPQTNAHSRELRNDGSFDLGSFLAN
ncbi:hypothetical protein CVIRNUC_010193 [Coccomyxa viridis]|uniref:BZIP domain-containing protein n=1 Tax=Coccomyxa viridis TaxID=1274662 RepID=A0AAV1IIB1_9CHLO|nr:hypothetical protein CVIRNUC_010193 [Coccomyxa viridis]